MSDLCVCGEPAGDHRCLGDPLSPAKMAALEQETKVRTCSECGTADPTVQPGGGMCALCAELSALQAPAKEAEYQLQMTRYKRRVVLAWACLGAILILVACLVAVGV